MPHKPRSALRSFMSSEAAGGLILMAAAALAMVVANSPLAGGYFQLLHQGVGPLSIEAWINDGLMAFFFLLVGLEIKREMIDGRLSTMRRRVLPGLAALGGMAVPALVYVLIQRGDAAGLKGWAVPAATDIAFALGVLNLLGKRAPTSLKVFLTALAIIDDLGAVVIIALFYTQDLSLAALGGAATCLAVLAVLNRLKVHQLLPYLMVGAVLWAFTLMSGVHATLAGVLLALFIPLTRTPGAPESTTSPLHRLEHGLQPWVAFVVAPIFGFANAGVSLAGLTPMALLAPIPLGAALGLFLGKQVGVFGAAWLAVRLNWAEKPAFATWGQVYGVSILCGVGFTMSIFIGLLAFDDAARHDAVKLGVIAGSVASALLAAAVIGLTGRRVAVSS